MVQHRQLQMPADHIWQVGFTAHKITLVCGSQMVIIDIVINTILGRLTLDPAGMHSPACDDGARAFAIAGPTVWNSLPDSLRDPAVEPDQFRRDLKTHLFE